MDFIEILGMASGLAFAVERAMEVVKIGYLKIKKILIPTLEQEELVRNEKVVLTIIVAVGGTILCGQAVILPIPGIIALPIWIQQIITGLIISAGGGILHTLYTILVSIKDNFEATRALKEQ